MESIVAEYDPKYWMKGHVREAQHIREGNAGALGRIVACPWRGKQAMLLQLPGPFEPTNLDQASTYKCAHRKRTELQWATVSNHKVANWVNMTTLMGFRLHEGSRGKFCVPDG